ncbi:Nif3-like dinuclear metal center hexameric protein [Pontibacillus sp. HMF3514]|uniref:Nif3-like dinuclear metal center hexameric protein n=1 Tax=Pontibacillus sp. HMF3514 TaxID=2692425 RepID=UPI00131F5132|nr:Nif3-like dinuclear metal center hexameric protein [Pontibacillus sp. HMF3514]QHE53360.1 Nif3-like dinuclear metal center hexameric protein [Pontibacillus sp. HMF3514]
MELEQFEKLIESLFSKELLLEFYDDYGFTYKTNRSIINIGYATNLSLETIDEAIKNDIDLMITHHDAWDFLYGLREECVKQLEKHQISHFFIHGPLDFIDFGTCTSLMDVLGIDEIKKFATFNDEEFPAVGEFFEEIEFNSLVEKIRSELQEPVRAWRHHHGKVKRIGILTGAGHSSDVIKKALEEGCDTYITGEATLYTIQYAKFVGVNLLVGSHTFTEIFGVESLAKKVREAFPDTEIARLKEEHFELNH